MSMGKSLGTIAPPNTTAPQQIELEQAIAETKPKPVKRVKPEPVSTTRTTGKSSNPDYERLTTYVPKALKKKAARKWEDATDGQDMSDLIEELLTKYLNT